MPGFFSFDPDLEHEKKFLLLESPAGCCTWAPLPFLGRAWESELVKGLVGDSW